jgi:hypothetical protein
MGAADEFAGKAATNFGQLTSGLGAPDGFVNLRGGVLVALAYLAFCFAWRACEDARGATESVCYALGAFALAMLALRIWIY